MKRRLELQKVFGKVLPDANLRKVASLAHKLSSLQPQNSGEMTLHASQIDGNDDELEFGADLVFQPPARFLVDVSLEDGDLLLGEESNTPSSSFHEGWHDHGDSTNYHTAVDAGNFDLEWLRNACDKIVEESNSQLSQDELAMAICRVLDLDKPGDEVMI